MQKVLFCMLILVVLVPGAFPQASTASVSGTVRDQSGAVIPSASVTLTNKATNVSSKTTANEVGFYLFPGVVPGPYLVSVEAAGMQKFEGSLAVTVAQSATVNVTMSVGQTATEVAVKDVTPMLVTDNATLSHTLERTRIEQLPLNGRAMTSLLQTVPGMEGTRAFGLRDFSFSVSLDGAALEDRYTWNTLTPRQPGLDSIQEFRVENNSSSAKYARPTSIIATTKGGTNSIHGAAFETNRNSGYGVARQRQDTWTKPSYLNRNEFGVSAGGPIYIPKVYNGKNKAFWFTSFEWMRQIAANTLQASLPTAEMRNGDFSQLINSNGVNLQTIYDPWTTDSTTWSRQPYPGNKIPQSKESPLAKYLLPVTQMPTITGVNPFNAVNYVGNWSQPRNEFTTASRVDYKLGDKDSFYGRYSLGHMTNRSQFYGIPTMDWNKAPGNTQQTTAPNWSYAASWVHTFSPTFFNEFLFTGTRTKQDTLTGDGTTIYDTLLGLPNPFNSAQWPGLYNVAFNGSTLYETQNGTSFYAFYGIIDDNATKIVGKHELQFGFHYRADRMNLLPQQQQTGGSDSWASTATNLYDPTTSRLNPSTTPFTGDQFANFFIGVGRYNNQLNRGMFYARAKEYSGYFQDNWRATPRLTLNLGLRYEVYPPFYEKNNTVASFDAANHAVVLGAPLDKFFALGATFPSITNRLASFGVKYEQNDQAGLPDHQINTSHDGFGPRLGFAYRALDGKKSFVIRGGYRISYFHFVMGGWAARMRMNIPMTARFYGPWGDPEQGSYAPDGINNWWLRNVPQFISGQNTTNALVQPTDARSLNPGCCSVSYFSKDMPDPRVQDWNLTFEKELMTNTIARAGYIGNHSTRLEQKYMYNEGTPAYIWYMTKGVALPTGTYSGVLTRPYDTTGAYATLEQWQNTGWGNSNGISLELERRYSKGYAYQVFYVMDNNFAAGGQGYSGTSNIYTPNQYLPGAIPTDINAYNRLLNYQRDTGVPQHRVRWNFLVDLPVGKGKPLLGSSGKWLNRLVGGWQIAGMGSLQRGFTSLPTGMFPTGTPLQQYGYKYPIQDCTSGKCYPAYLWDNGYIPAYRINSTDPKTGLPNGYMGIPSDYKPAWQPLWPYPADYLSRSSATDPLYAYYGGNTLWLPIKDANGNNIIQRQGWSGLDPLRQQYIPAQRTWGLDASAFKMVPITESINFRLNIDFFNVLNHPGNPTGGGSGILSVRNSGQGARVMQLTGRFTW